MPVKTESKLMNISQPETREKQFVGNQVVRCFKGCSSFQRFNRSIKAKFERFFEGQRS